VLLLHLLLLLQTLALPRSSSRPILPAAAGLTFGSGIAIAIQAGEEVGVWTLAVAIHLAATPAGNVVAAEHRDINEHVLAFRHVWSWCCLTKSVA